MHNHDDETELRRPWQGSNRRSRLPGNWAELRRIVLERDGYRCTYRFPNGGRCPEPATDVDHVNRGDDHGLDNLTSLCERHHQWKSSQEGGRVGGMVTQQKRREIHKRMRRNEKHPGEL